jgi:competence protein ComEC
VPEPKNPLEFDYKKYLSFHLINQQAFLKTKNWTLLEQPEHQNIYAFADLVRRKMIFTLEQLGLTNNELGVASALILGYKNNIEAQLKSAYSSAGAMHVLAVSGLHVGIIFMIFNALLKFLDKLKYGAYLKGILLLLILWCYALITGLSPSVMRSASMFSFVVIGKAFQRNSNFFNTLSASALLLLLVNPLLIFDVGFQLSYTAVAGIVLMQPWLGGFYSPNSWLGNYIWELITVSIAAQIATFPLGLYYFHQFPNYFLLSNLLVIPFALAILILGLTTLAFSFVPILGIYLGFCLKWLVFALNWTVTFIDQLPFAVTNNIKFTFANVVAVYCIIACIILLIAYRKFKYFLGFGIFSLFLLFSIAHDKYQLLYQKKFIVYNIPKHTAINFIDGDDNILVSDIMLSNDKVKFHVQNNWIDKGIKSEKVVNLEQLKKEHLVSNIYKIDNKNLFTKRSYFQYYNYKIGIIDKNFTLFNPTKKITVDALIWTQNCKIPLEKVIQLYDFKLLIIDSSNSTYVNDKLVAACGLLKLECWSVLNEGAFGVDL